jgi:hypothetical protein
MADRITSTKSFRMEAQWQKVCAVCRKPGPFQAHHVVDKAILRNRCHLSGAELYDTRNALRLCQQIGSVEWRCHFQHENTGRLVKTSELLDDNIEYAFEVLGAFAADYLRREYDDSEPDARIAGHLATLEAA